MKKSRAYLATFFALTGVLSGCASVFDPNGARSTDARLRKQLEEEHHGAPPETWSNTPQTKPSTVTFSMPGNVSATSRPAAAPPAPAYSGPHKWSVQRGSRFGYTDASSGEVHFFEYQGFQQGRRRLFADDGSFSRVILCSDPCNYVDIVGYDGVRTFEVKRGTILAAVITDMLNGALTATR